MDGPVFLARMALLTRRACHYNGRDLNEGLVLLVS